MATTNPFDLLGDDDNEDPSQLIAAAQLKVADKPKKPAAAAAPQPTKPAKLPSKPLPPTQAVREAKSEGGRGAGRSGGGGRGYGRSRGGAGGFNRELNNDANNGYSGGYRPSEEGESGKPAERRSYGAPRGSGGGSGGGFRGARRGGFSNGEAGEGERPRRQFERRSGTGRGSEFKRDGAGRGNWGTPTDELAPESGEPAVENEKNVSIDKLPGEEDAPDANKDSPATEPEEKEPEDKEMTLEEYEKILEEKKKALQTQKVEGRNVDVTKEFGSMLQLSNKKSSDDVFIKLGSEKDKRKEAAEKEERAKKSVSINEFLKPAEGERYYPSGRGRGRGRGSRGGYGGNSRDAAAPAIEDPGQFPSLGGK